MFDLNDEDMFLEDVKYLKSNPDLLTVFELKPSEIQIKTNNSERSKRMSEEERIAIKTKIDEVSENVSYSEIKKGVRDLFSDEEIRFISQFDPNFIEGITKDIFKYDSSGWSRYDIVTKKPYYIEYSTYGYWNKTFKEIKKAYNEDPEAFNRGSDRLIVEIYFVSPYDDYYTREVSYDIHSGKYFN